MAAKKGQIYVNSLGDKMVLTKVGTNGKLHELKFLNGSKLSKGSVYAVDSHLKTLYKNTGKKYKGGSRKKTGGGKGG